MKYTSLYCRRKMKDLIIYLLHLRLPVWISVNDLDADNVYTDATGEAIMFDNFGLMPTPGLVRCVAINEIGSGEWSAENCNGGFLSLCSLVIGG